MASLTVMAYRRRAGARYLHRVNGIRRRRHPVIASRYRPAVLALCVLGLGAFATWQADRIWTAPIRGTAAFAVGLGIGLGVGLVAAAGWAASAFRRPLSPRLVRWQWMTALAWFAVVVVTSPSARYGPGVPAMRVTNGFVVGALAYSVAAFIGSGCALGAVLARRFAEARR